MPRSRSRHPKTRRTPKVHPCGALNLTGAGYGFVQTAEGEFFIPSSKTADAFDGDIVEVAHLPHGSQGQRSGVVSGGRPVGRVVRVLSRAHECIVGRYEVAEPFGVVVPEDPRIKHDIFTVRRDAPHVKDGDIVRVRMTVYPSRREPAQGIVEEVLGHDGDAGVDVELVIARHKLETHFTPAALEEVKDAQVDAQGALASGRYRDLTARTVFTIDPDDAKDFDDALSLDCIVLPVDAIPDVAASRRFPSRCDDAGSRNDACCAHVASFSRRDAETSAGFSAIGAAGANAVSLEEVGCEAAAAMVARGEALWRLGVHIADVSHYVSWGSSVDLDARRRATSVYLVDRVIPMLPEKLSNDVCSLKPREDRRALSVDLYMDAQGSVRHAEVFPSVIRSCARLTYGWVQHALDALRDGDEAAALSHISGAAGVSSAVVFARIAGLDRIARMLYAARVARGGMDFESQEAKVRLDAQGHPVGVDVRVKTDATSLVEESMIAANEAVARFLRDSKTASIYRVHEAPAPVDLLDLKPILQEFGYDRHVSLSALVSGDSFAIQKVLEHARGRAEEYLVSALIVRAMKRAVYRDACGLHYGLASEAYTHFTSPIRRYPDLMVHRMVKVALFGRSEETSAEEAMMARIAEHSSMAERTAEAAARESQELKLYEFLAQRAGEEAEGIISGVIASGFFVRLDDTSEGFVALRNAGEYWMLDAQRRTLTGSDTGEVYRLGMRVRIRIGEVRPIERRADFVLIGKAKRTGRMR